MGSGSGTVKSGGGGRGSRSDHRRPDRRVGSNNVHGVNSEAAPGRAAEGESQDEGGDQWRATGGRGRCVSDCWRDRRQEGRSFAHSLMFQLDAAFAG